MPVVDVMGVLEQGGGFARLASTDGEEVWRLDLGEAGEALEDVERGAVLRVVVSKVLPEVAVREHSLGDGPCALCGESDGTHVYVREELEVLGRQILELESTRRAALLRVESLEASERQLATVEEALELTRLRVHEAEGTLSAQLEKAKEPVGLLLWCPLCGARHVDAVDPYYQAHHTHTCQAEGCGFLWRPAIRDTRGIGHFPELQTDNASPTARSHVRERWDAAVHLVDVLRAVVLDREGEPRDWPIGAPCPGVDMTEEEVALEVAKRALRAYDAAFPRVSEEA